MTIRGFKEPEAGQRLSATEMRRVFTAIETLTEITSEWPIVLDRGPTGQHIRFDLPLPFPAKITSGSNPYAWTEQYYTAAGMFAALPGGRSGTTTSTPAYERNANTTVPANTYVWLWPAKNNHNSLIYTASTVNGSPTVSNLSTTEDLAAGDAVSGTGIPGGATIQAVVDATTITLSANATATGSASLTFTTTRGLEYLFDSYKGLANNLSVGEADGSPLYTNVTDIRTNQTDGLTVSRPLVIRNGTTVNGKKIISGLSSTTSILSGMSVSGTGIAGSTTVSSVDSSFTVTGTLTNGSAVVTGIVSTADLVAGMAISGTGVPASTTIASVDSATQITLSANATATGSSVLTCTAQVILSANATASGTVPLTFYYSTSTVARTGNTTNASAVVTGLSTTSDLTAGDGVTGAGIPNATTISSVDSATQITLSAAATATGSPSLTFTYTRMALIDLIPATLTQAGGVSLYSQVMGDGNKTFNRKVIVNNGRTASTSSSDPIFQVKGPGSNGDGIHIYDVGSGPYLTIGRGNPAIDRSQIILDGPNNKSIFGGNSFSIIATWPNATTLMGIHNADNTQYYLWFNAGGRIGGHISVAGEPTVDGRLLISATTSASPPAALPTIKSTIQLNSQSTQSGTTQDGAYITPKCMADAYGVYTGGTFYDGIDAVQAGLTFKKGLCTAADGSIIITSSSTYTSTGAQTIGNGGSIKGGTSSTGSTSGALQAPMKSGTGPAAIAATAGSVMGSTSTTASGGKLYYNPTGTTSWNTVMALEDADTYIAPQMFSMKGQ